MNRERQLELLHRTLAQEEEHLLLIELQKSKYLFETDIPLNLIEAEERKRNRIADLKRRIAELEDLPPEPVRPTPVASGVWPCPGDTTRARYVGSVSSKKYHRSSCRYAGPDILFSGNRLCFKSRKAAQEFGRVPCGVCRP